MKIKLIAILLIICFENISLKDLVDKKELIISPADGEHVIMKRLVHHKKTITRKKIKRLRDNIPQTNVNTGNNYISYCIFFPLVLFIFTMTIISVIGFFVVMFSSLGKLNTEDNLNTTVIKNNLTNSELLEILRLKKLIKQRIKTTNQAAPFE
jgi:hypothetical protein